MKRRALLSTALGSSIIVSGCLAGGEDTTVEIIPSNSTNRQLSLDVAVYATDGSLLLDHSYSLAPGKSNASQGVENRVDHLIVSPNGRKQVTHEYNPDVGMCSRAGEDVQINVTTEDIIFTYSC